METNEIRCEYCGRPVSRCECLSSRLPERPKVYRFGCDDCGCKWERKADVDVRCRPYVGRIVKDGTTFSGYAWSDCMEIGTLWTGGY